MKHLKLYESFDRYDFKKHTLLTNTKDELGEMYSSMVEGSRIPFEKEELDVIKSINNASEIYYVGSSNINYVFYRINDLSQYNSGVYLYAHGDYCYSLFELDRSDIKSIETFDGFDELCVELRKIIDLNTNINESFDRYDFGINANSSKIYDTVQEISKDALLFTDSEYAEIENGMPRGKLERGPGYLIITGSIFDRVLNIYSVGDYCYLMTVGNFAINGYTYYQMHTVDGIEGLIEAIQFEYS